MEGQGYTDVPSISNATGPVSGKTKASRTYPLEGMVAISLEGMVAISMERTDELVSIIMPAYNAEETIAMAIRSVLNQTYTHWELFVIDDGYCVHGKHIHRPYGEIDGLSA